MSVAHIAMLYRNDNASKRYTAFMQLDLADLGITVRLSISKQDVVNAVLEALDRQAACTAGAGTPRSVTLDGMPLTRDANGPR